MNAGGERLRDETDVDRVDQNGDAVDDLADERVLAASHHHPGQCCGSPCGGGGVSGRILACFNTNADFVKGLKWTDRIEIRDHGGEVSPAEVRLTKVMGTLLSFVHGMRMPT